MPAAFTIRVQVGSVRAALRVAADRTAPRRPAGCHQHARRPAPARVTRSSHVRPGPTCGVSLVVNERETAIGQRRSCRIAIRAARYTIANRAVACAAHIPSIHTMIITSAIEPSSNLFGAVRAGLHGIAALRQTPHVPPSLAHRLQELQLRQALQGLAPVQVAACVTTGARAKPTAPSKAMAIARRRVIEPAPLGGKGGREPGSGQGLPLNCSCGECPHLTQRAYPGGLRNCASLPDVRSDAVARVGDLPWVCVGLNPAAPRPLPRRTC